MKIHTVEIMMKMKDEKLGVVFKALYIYVWAMFSLCIENNIQSLAIIY